MIFIVMSERQHVPHSRIKQRCNVDAQTLCIRCELHRVRAHLHPRQAQRTGVAVFTLLPLPLPPTPIHLRVYSRPVFSHEPQESDQSGLRARVT